MSRRKAIDQAMQKTWYGSGRDQQIKLAKAYLMDAVQQQANESDRLSVRVEQGIRLLVKALSGRKSDAV